MLCNTFSHYPEHLTESNIKNYMNQHKEKVRQLEQTNSGTH